jgi:hypothetical protein
MTAALAFIASCLVGAFLIELHARYRMNRLMALRVEALNLTHDSDRGEHSTEAIHIRQSQAKQYPSGGFSNSISVEE